MSKIKETVKEIWQDRYYNTTTEGGTQWVSKYIMVNGVKKEDPLWKLLVQHHKEYWNEQKKNYGDKRVRAVPQNYTDKDHGGGVGWFFPVWAINEQQRILANRRVVV